MSIIKESLQETFKSKLVKRSISLLGLIFFGFLLVVGYFFSEFSSYKEVVHNVVPVKINVKVVMNKKDSQEIFFTVEGEEKMRVHSLKSCKINKSIAGKTLNADMAEYSYTTWFRSGENKRLLKLDSLFCPTPVTPVQA